MTSKEQVLKEYPEAFVDWFLSTFEYVIWSCDDPSQRILGRGPKRYAAWEDAARRLPAPTEPAPKGDETCTYGIHGEECRTTGCQCKCHAIVEPAPKEGEKEYEVFEVYGASARARGWDFLVCKSMKNALDIIESDMDELDADPDASDEVKIVFRRYTKEQMDEVVYE